MRRDSFLGVIAASALGACAGPVSHTPFEDIQDGGEPLRAAFNDDAGKVRIMLLVSPT
jgi:hypothetical protein